MVEEDPNLDNGETGGENENPTSGSETTGGETGSETTGGETGGESSTDEEFPSFIKAYKYRGGFDKFVYDQLKKNN